MANLWGNISDETWGPRASRRNLSSLWQQLLVGELSIVELTTANSRSRLVAVEKPESSTKTSPRNRWLLERVLCGVRRKVICAELGLSESTLAHVLKRLLLRMGVNAQPGRVPEPLVLLVQAACGEPNRSRTHLRQLETPNGRVFIVTHEIVPLAHERLTPAENDVLRQRAAGLSYADIARRRNTSQRTIANQIASAMRRLNTSGDLSSLHQLYASSPAEGARAPAAAHSPFTDPLTSQDQA